MNDDTAADLDEIDEDVPVSDEELEVFAGTDRTMRIPSLTPTRYPCC